MLRNASIALAVLLLAGPSSADTIRLIDGTSIDEVQVRKESWKEIEYKKKRVSANQTVEAAKVASIVYSRTSADFREAATREADGELLAAAAYYDAAASDENVSDHVRALARVRQANALLQNGSWPDATAAFDQLLKDFPDTRHLARARLGKAKALFGSADLGAAGAEFVKLRQEADEKGLGQQYALEAEFFVLLVAEAQGSADLAGYESLRKRVAASHPAIASRCSVRIGRIHLADTEFAQAEKLFQQIIDDRSEVDREVVAEAFNGRGHCHFARGQVELDRSETAAAAGNADEAEIYRVDAQEAYRSAVLDFLRVFVSYRDVQAQQAEALYWAAQCFLNIEGEKSPGRAAQLLKTCATRYEDSQWGKAAAAQG